MKKLLLSLLLIASVAHAGPGYFASIGVSSDSVQGTTNQITATANSDNTVITLSTPQDLDTGADFQVGTLLSGNGAVGVGAGALQLGDAGYFGIYNTSGSFAFSRGGVNILSANGTYLNGNTSASGRAAIKHTGTTGKDSPIYTFTGDSDSGMTWISANEMGISTAGLSVATFSNRTASDNSGLALINGTLRLDQGDYIDIPIAISTARANPTLTPTYSTFLGNTSAWNFTTGDFGDYLDFNVKVPHGHESETDLELHAHINPNGSTNTGNVVIEVECSSFAEAGESFSASTAIYNGVQAIDGTARKNYTLDLGTISGTGVGFGSLAQCAITRRAAASEFPDAIFPLVVGFHIRVDSLGADAIDSKTDY